VVHGCQVKSYGMHIRMKGKTSESMHFLHALFHKRSSCIKLLGPESKNYRHG
jgi:hypothetical protein